MNLFFRKASHSIQSFNRIQFTIPMHLSTETSVVLGPIASIIKQKLSTELHPEVLEIINESYKHNVPPNSESHFKVLVVSKQFDGKSMIERHRAVNRVLAEELKNSIHALSIQALTEEQWRASPTLLSTPNCMGGGAKK